MAIPSKAQVNFYGTELQVINDLSGIADGDFTSTVTTFTNTDNVPSASFLFEIGLNAAASPGGYIALYAKPINMGSGNRDQIAPSAFFKSTFIGSIVVPGAAAGLLTMSFDTFLPSYNDAQEYEFYVENKTGQSLTAVNCWISPKALGPKA